MIDKRYISFSKELATSYEDSRNQKRQFIIINSLFENDTIWFRDSNVDWNRFYI